MIFNVEIKFFFFLVFIFIIPTQGSDWNGIPPGREIISKILFPFLKQTTSYLLQQTFFCALYNFVFLKIIEISIYFLSFYFCRFIYLFFVGNIYFVILALWLMKFLVSGFNNTYKLMPTYAMLSKKIKIKNKNRN